MVRRHEERNEAFGDSHCECGHGDCWEKQSGFGAEAQRTGRQTVAERRCAVSSPAIVSPFLYCARPCLCHYWCLFCLSWRNYTALSARPPSATLSNQLTSFFCCLSGVFCLNTHHRGSGDATVTLAPLRHQRCDNISSTIVINQINQINQITVAAATLHPT